MLPPNKAVVNRHRAVNKESAAFLARVTQSRRAGR